MEFNKKIQELRKQKGLTQEDLAEKLYVSRTAISKWESGKGYPNIDSIKEIAKFFGITIDDLLSGDQLLMVANADKQITKKHLCDLVFGLINLSVALLLFLPFFAIKKDDIIQSVSLLNLYSVQLYVKTAYFVVVFASILIGIMFLALQNCNSLFWVKCKTPTSLILSVISVILFIISLQPYASVFAFVLLAIKGLILLKS